MESRVLDDEPGILPTEELSSGNGNNVTSNEVMAAEEAIDAPSHDEVAELAYSYWEARGGHGGSAWEDWFRAEQELKSRRQA